MRRASIFAFTVLTVACDPHAPTARSPVEERVVVLTATGEDEAGGGPAHSSTTSSGRPLFDTWTVQAGGGFYDYGKSCELKVSHLGVPNPKRALLKFALPGGLPCGSIISATLTLTTAQLPAAGSLTVLARKVTNPWTAGSTGLAGCSTCWLSSGAAAPFVMPNSSPAHSTPVSDDCQTHSWPVTSMVVDWCSSPSTNHGVLLEGVGTFPAPEVNFHSMEAPSGRPTLTIVFP